MSACTTPADVIRRGGNLAAASRTRRGVWRPPGGYAARLARAGRRLRRTLLGAALLIVVAGEGPASATDGEAGQPLPPASFENVGWHRSENGGRHRRGEADPKRADRWADLGSEADGAEAARMSAPGAPRAATLAPDAAPAAAAKPDRHPNGDADADGDTELAPRAPHRDPKGDGDTDAEAGAASDADTDAGSEGEGEDDSEADADAKAKIEALCEQLAAAADRHAVPHDFFIRLIWKESRFNANAVSPVGAQGIAQFMPMTARARGLGDPFDPDQALPASAHFLRDLKSQFGVWGLAAAGYNAGPNRVLAYLAGRSGLPYETLDFVYSITGREADYWKLRAGRLKAARSSPPSAPRPLPLRSETLAAPGRAASLAPDVAEAKAATPAIAPPLAASAQDGRASGGGAAAVAARATAARDGTSVEGTGVKIAIHRPRVTDGPPDDLGPSVAGILVHRPNRSGRTGEASPVAAAFTAANVAVPRLRPEIAPRPVDCARLIVALGRARTTPRPAFGGGGAGGWSPWGAQVAGHPQRAIALRQFGRHRARLPGDLQSPLIIVRRFPARGRLPIHAVQFGAGSRSQAQATCARVAKALVPCVVVKNR